ncbi:MAG: hypothetical protein AAGA90_01220 [Actinomycetota bacterium]
MNDHPVIGPRSHPSIGTNIQGPSVIRAPDWLPDPLGRYLMYFADHKGAFIRLAYADAVAGPWTVHPPGSLQLAESHFPVEPPPLDDATFERMLAGYRALLGDDLLPADVRDDLVHPHIASPDVHVDHDRRELVMYFHGLESVGAQHTRVAVSGDGVRFHAHRELHGPSYFRAFAHDGWWYALAMPGLFLRSRDGRTGFEPGPTLFEPDMRHSAVRVRGDDPATGGPVLEVLWTRVGDAPERVLQSLVDLRGDWSSWRELGAPVEVLRPERDWEGADQPVVPSFRGAIGEPVNQLRDPCLFEDDGRTFLFYAVAGEAGIGVAELHDAVD